VHSAFVFPRFKILSGAERLILKLADSLIQKGHSVSIICHQFHPSCLSILPAKAQLLCSGSRIDFFKNRYLNAAFDYAKNGELLRLIPSSADAICCFGPALTLSPKIKSRFDRPLLYFCYEPPRFLYTDRSIIRSRLGILAPLAGPIFRFYKNQDKKQIEKVDKVICNSEFGKSLIQNIYHREADIITHGLDAYRASNHVEEIRQKLGLDSQDIAVITVNYLHPRKRLDLFIAAIEKARKSFPRMRGIVVGEGPERPSLQDLGGDSIRFTGFVREEELTDYYQAADLYLHTARLETFGLSVIEASGNRLPVVSVREGGPLETVLHEETGYLCEPSESSLAEALVRLAENGELRKRLGENGFRYVRAKYSWSKAGEDFLNSVSNSNSRELSPEQEFT
jgi:glycosyltransferase involved in cell wall biosynthesis